MRWSRSGSTSSTRSIQSESEAALMNCGTLYLVATPIGNLEDMTFRAVRVLREVALVAAEDTRHSRKLFQHYAIKTPLTSYFAHNEAEKGGRLLERLQAGDDVALISDAGTPAISDPGFLLVQRCRELGVAVTMVPGASAVVTALAISGLPTERFIFEGFLPSRGPARREQFRRLREETRTTIFYEAPHRIQKSLVDLVAELGPERRIAVARELTKLHEELVSGSAAEVLERATQEKLRGEMVLLIGPAPQTAPRETVREALLRLRQETGLPMRQIVKQVAKEHGLPGSEVYRQSLALKDQSAN
jgi:16S rRNA (cytidine1402-2'-O)-methyltransferase